MFIVIYYTVRMMYERTTLQAKESRRLHVICIQCIQTVRFGTRVLADNWVSVSWLFQ